MARIEVHDALHVPRPRNMGRILRASNNEFLVWQLARRSAKQLVDFGLAVWSVCAHVAQVALEARIGGKFAMLFPIDRTVQRHGKRSAQLFFQPLEHGAASKAEIDVQLGKM